MKINIKTSEKSKERIFRLTNKLQSFSKTNVSHNIIARIALAYSLSKDQKLSLDNISDSWGKEFKSDVLLGNYGNIYISMIVQNYGIRSNDTNLPKYFKMHIDHGLELIDNELSSNIKITMSDLLLDYINSGIETLRLLKPISGHVKNNNLNVNKEPFTGELIIPVGENCGTNETIDLFLNDSTKYNNQHIAVAGSTGTGKTQFVLEFLRQVSIITKNQVNFIYLDYKGLKDEEINKLKLFFEATDANFINVPHEKFPINPLTFVDVVNEKNKLLGINKFVDIITKYSKIGKKQKLTLKNATNSAFENAPRGEHPTLTDIYEEFKLIAGDKPDTLREILESLSEFEIFDSRKKSDSILNNNHYISLSGDLPNAVRFTSVFLIIYYLYNLFMSMTDVQTGNVAGMRYIIAIDEAHVLFKERGFQEVLEEILRTVRSKGVSVMLLSQGIDEYDQQNFNFSSISEIAFLLKIKDLNIKKIQGFLGYTPEKATALSRELEKLEKGKVISNIKEHNSIKPFNVKQFWKESKKR